MVANTDIKFYVHTNNNAPELQDAYGSMINVLDACLVDGIQIGVVSSLIASGKTITATFSFAHNLMQYQVIKITGATQSEFNGEHRILTVPNAQSVTFELEVNLSTTSASGTITASLPPLGWEKPFSSANAGGGGKAAYRSKNLLLPSRPFLRVVDELDPAYTATYAKYAKVGIVEDMADIDTMLGVQAPFDAENPDKNWVGIGSGATVINGWAKWYFSRAHDEQTSGAFDDTYATVAGKRKYIIVGSKDYFYLIPCLTLTGPGYPYGFGAFDSYLSQDGSNTFLAATLTYETANNTTHPAQYNSLGGNSAETLLLQRNTQQIKAALGRCMTIGNGVVTSGTNVYGSIDINNTVTSGNVSIKEGVNNNLRGELPGFKWIFQNMPYLDRDIIYMGSSAYIAVNLNNRIASSNVNGQIILKIGEL